MRIKKWPLRIVLLGCILLNISAGFHAYKFTHFSPIENEKSRADELGTIEKISILLFGISNPRPKNETLPKEPYEVVKIQSGEEELEGWYLKTDSPKGEVILFHGYSGKKASMLHKAYEIKKMGYNTLLIDFRGSGGSTGNSTTIGYKESKDVKSAVAFLQSRGGKNMYLLGTSMGAVAIMKMVSEKNVAIDGIILECPFGSLLQTAKNRFETMGLPTFPAAHLLVFWGGIENGFWGFSHKPLEYSHQIGVRTLLMYGEQDPRVQRFEIDTIYSNLKGEKELVLFPKAGHGNYLETDTNKWIGAIEEFLN